MKTNLAYGVGIALLSLPLQTYGVLADTVTINNEQTDPKATTNVDGGVAGDIDITPTGSVTVASGTALTINSNNSITNAGLVEVSDSDNAVGVSILGGYTGSFTNSGAIQLHAADDDTHKSGKTGIALTGASSFTGDIFNSLAGSVEVSGDNSFGVRIDTGLAGDFINNGSIDIRGANSTGVLIGAAVSGDFSNTGSIISQLLTSDVDGDPDTPDYLTTNAAVAVGASIAGGFSNEGKIQSSGSPWAILISPDQNSTGPANIVIGPVTGLASGEAFFNSDTITADPQTTLDVGAVRIEGLDVSGTIYTTTLVGGMRNEGEIAAVSVDANSVGLSIGAHAIVPTLTNTGSLTSNAFHDTTKGDGGAHTSIALDISSTTGTMSIDNSGSILAIGNGVGGSSTAIIDRAGTVTSLTNTGRIFATYNVDSDDDVNPLPGTAIDLSANTSGITFSNNQVDNSDGFIGGDILFGSGNDVATMGSGAIEGDIAFGGGNNSLTLSGGTIAGDILFGSGNDTATMGAGSIEGDITFGSGNDSLIINGGIIDGDLLFGTGTDFFRLTSSATLQGDLVSTSGGLSAEIYGTLALQTTQNVALSSLIIGSNADISFLIDPSLDTGGTFEVTGVATVDSSALFNPTFKRLLATESTFDVLSAGTLTLSSGLPVFDFDAAPFLYRYDAVLNLTDPLVDKIQITVTPKTATELGVTNLQRPIFHPLLELGEADDNVANALHGIESNQELGAALNGILPNQTSAQYMLSFLTLQGIADSATDKRVILPDNLGTKARFWLEQTGTYRDETGTDDVRGYIGSEFKMSGGVDISTNLFERLGVAVTQSYIGFKPEGAPSGPYGITSTWFSLYASSQIGQLTINATGSAALSKFRSERNLFISGQEFQADSDWDGNLWGGQLEARYHFEKDGLYVDPRVSLAFLSLSEDSYSESGDIGIKVAASDFSMDGLRSEIGAVFGVRFGDQKSILTAELELGLRKDFASSDASRNYALAGGVSSFALTTLAPEEEAGLVGLNIFGSSNLTSLGFSYKGAFGSDTQDHQIKAVLKTRF